MGPASGAATSITLVPPYLHVTDQKISYAARSPCGGARITNAPILLNRTTAILHWSASASVGYCRNFGGPGTFYGANLEAEVLVWVPLPTLAGLARPTNISATWNVTAAGSIAHHLGPCPNVSRNSAGFGTEYCQLEVDAGYQSSGAILDVSNGSSIGPTNYSPHPTVAAYFLAQNYTVCSAHHCHHYRAFGGTGGLAFSGSTSSTWWFNATLNHSHRYIFEAEFDSDVVATISGYGPGSIAAAALDLSTAGQGAQLVSIVES